MLGCLSIKGARSCGCLFASGKWAERVEQGRAVVRGSILIEAIVTLGLIASMTPIIYSHISSRKAEIEDINKANTFLILQKHTNMYLKEDYSTLLTEINAGGGNYIIKTPIEINPDFGDTLNMRYAVGIKKNTDNTLDAMIVELATSGKDARAGKIAGMVGVSAGIYSSMDMDNAWGLNGVWSEPLSDYFGADADLIPAGTTVVTTAYDKVKDKIYVSDIFTNSDLDMDGYDITGIGTVVADKVETKEVVADKLTSGEICVGGECFKNVAELKEKINEEPEECPLKEGTIVADLDSPSFWVPKGCSGRYKFSVKAGNAEVSKGCCATTWNDSTGCEVTSGSVYKGREASFEELIDDYSSIRIRTYEGCSTKLSANHKVFYGEVDPTIAVDPDYSLKAGVSYSMWVNDFLIAFALGGKAACEKWTADTSCGYSPIILMTQHWGAGVLKICLRGCHTTPSRIVYQTPTKGNSFDGVHEADGTYVQYLGK